MNSEERKERNLNQVVNDLLKRHRGPIKKPNKRICRIEFWNRMIADLSYKEGYNDCQGHDPMGDGHTEALLLFCEGRFKKACEDAKK